MIQKIREMYLSDREFWLSKLILQLLKTLKKPSIYYFLEVVEYFNFCYKSITISINSFLLWDPKYSRRKLFFQEKNFIFIRNWWKIDETPLSSNYFQLIKRVFQISVKFMKLSIIAIKNLENMQESFQFMMRAWYHKTLPWFRPWNFKELFLNGLILHYWYCYKIILHN